MNCLQRGVTGKVDLKTINPVFIEFTITSETKLHLPFQCFYLQHIDDDDDDDDNNHYK